MLLSLCSLPYKSHFKSPGISTLLVPYIDAAAVGSGELHRSCVSHSNPRFASDGERIMQVSACAFQHMKVFRCTTKKAGLILSQELSPIGDRRWQLSSAAILQVIAHRMALKTITCSFLMWQRSHQGPVVLPQMDEFPHYSKLEMLSLELPLFSLTFPYCNYILTTSRWWYQLESFPYPCPDSYWAAALSRRSLV